MGMEIQSKEVIDKISDELKLQPAMKIPRELMEKIQLVYNVNPKRVVNVARGTTSTTTGEVSAFVTPTDRDFFLTHINISTASDVVCDNTRIAVLVTPEGNTRLRILSIVKETLTVHQESAQLALVPPLKVERGSNITLQTIFTVGFNERTIEILGFFTDPQ